MLGDGGVRYVLLRTGARFSTSISHKLSLKFCAYRELLMNTIVS